MSSPTLSLESLEQYSDEQASKINQLIGRGFAFSETLPKLNVWVEFRNSLWGKGLPHLRDSLSSATKSVVQIPEMIPEALDLPGKKILVRSEYEIAEQAILSANDNGREALRLQPPVPSGSRRTVDKGYGSQSAREAVSGHCRLCDHPIKF